LPDEHPSDRIVIAVVTRPHGLRGAVRVKVFNPDTDVLAPGAKLTVTCPGASPRRLLVRAAQSGKETWVVTFDESDSLQTAEALRGAEISVLREELPPADEGEFYFADLVGCAVVDAAGAPFGTIRDVMHYPSVDALVVKTESSEIEVPFVDGIVLSVDLAARLVRIDSALLEGS